METDRSPPGSYLISPPYSRYRGAAEGVVEEGEVDEDVKLRLRAHSDASSEGRLPSWSQQHHQLPGENPTLGESATSSSEEFISQVGINQLASSKQWPRPALPTTSPNMFPGCASTNPSITNTDPSDAIVSYEQAAVGSIA